MTLVADVVFPCLDEAEALPWVLPRVPEGFRAIVVDNGSTDDSVQVARAHGATVVDQPRRGFGAACHSGLLAATADIVAFCDADGSLDPALLPQVVGPVESGTADLSLGRRRARGLRAWPLHARVANVAISAWVRRRSEVQITDIGPMRAAGREALLGLELQDRRFGYPLEMIVRAAEHGWTIEELDVEYRPRTGRSKVTGTVRGTVRTISDMQRVLATTAGPRSGGR